MRALSLLLLLPSILAAGTWQGEAPGGFLAEITVSDEKVIYPRAVKIDLVLTYPEEYHVDLEALKKNLLHPSAFEASPFSLEAMTKISKALSESHQIRQTIHLSLKPEGAGHFFLTFREIQFFPQEGNPVTIISNLFPVEVALPAVDPDVLQPKRPLPLSQAAPILLSPELRKERDALAAEEPTHNTRVYEEAAFPWMGLFVLLLGGMFLFISRGKPAPPPKLDQEAIAREVALRTLEELRSAGLPPDQYYVRVSDLMRTFVWERYQVDLPTKTTQESFHAKDLSSAIGDEAAEQLLQFLLEADRVKFAQQSASETACSRATRLAQQII